MAEPANVFAAQPASEQPAQVDTSVDSWVGEGKKFATIEQLVESYGHAQAHINTLESSYQGLEKDLDKRLTVEEMVKQIQTPEATQHTTEPVQEQGTSTEGLATLTEDVNSTIDSKLSSFEARLQGDQNEREVSATLNSRFGDKAQVTLQAKAQELGKSIEDLQSMSRTDPKLFLALFPKTTGASNQGVMQSSVNTDNSNFSGSKQSSRDFKYWEEMRKGNSRDYFSPKMQALMFKDAQDQGTSFYG